MSNIVIKTEGVGKSYLIGHQSNERNVTFRDAIVNTTKSWYSKIRNSQGQTKKHIEVFWALKDVSFEVKKGERIGIIGRNGAGKSTLLKILSRITDPTTGRIFIKGRVASLLEVGTGFHPELTGRENIYLNGAILGMSRQEIKHKFDEIVAFAEVEKFLDTPVKYFSSGMYVRLAFAVAAHLEPEILVVDEVLAVGDAQFQKKCLGKMEDVSMKEGRTVLFVSHNISAINAFCNKAILLEEGLLVESGNTLMITEKYFSRMRTYNKNVISSKTKPLQIEKWCLIDENQVETNVTYSNETLCIEASILNQQGPCELALGISVEDLNGARIFGGLSLNDHCTFQLNVGKSKLRCILNDCPLNEGIYYLSLAIHKLPSNEIIDKINQCMSFEVINRRRNGNTRITSKSNGLILVSPDWIKLKE